VIAAALAALLHLLATGLVRVDVPPPHLDAVAVHGGGSPLYERERPAVDLLKSGAADWIVAMGGTLPPGDPDLTYAGATVRRLNELEVDLDRVIRIDQGLSTQTELAALRRVAEGRGWHKVALSSSPWHTRRVAMTAERVFDGSGIGWSVITGSPPGLDGWWSAPSNPVPVEWFKIGMLLVRS